MSCSRRPLKVHPGDTLSQSVCSLTSRGEQRLLLDRRHASLLRGRRVAVVDDVARTGSSLAAALGLVRDAEARVTAVRILLTQGHDRRGALGRTPDSWSRSDIPQFAPRDGGGAIPIEGTG